MISPDGETAEFTKQVELKGAVEVWLNDIESAMQVGLQKLLQGCVKQFKGNKEKWVKEWQGQLLITCGAINWTTDCHTSLEKVTSCSDLTTNGTS